MPHTVHDKKKLLNRVRRIRGQIEAIEKALEQEKDCHAVLQTVVACRGAINGLMGEMINGHIREHVLDPHEKLPPHRAEATEQLIDIVNAYLK